MPIKRDASGGQKQPNAALVVKSINTIRILSADMVEQANSGHPGAPIGCAPIAYILFHELMNHSPKNPKWSNRDRFVLSNGHACALLYSVLHLTGYNLTLDDLKQFRQFGSLTPGHPENFVTPGVEVATGKSTIFALRYILIMFRVFLGPLGQGISNAVGLAIAEAHLAAEFNKQGFPIVDHYTYVLCGDGCLQEGISSEACSLAGHLGLGKLIVCYDDNRITIDGDTSLSFTEDVNMRYEAYGWHVQTVDDVNDLDAVRAALEAARAEVSKPSMIKIRTIIGHGSSKEGTNHAHGAPLGATDLANVKQYYGCNPEQVYRAILLY
jgi:transketolase